MSGEIWVVPRNGQGHLLPTMELCKKLILLNHKINLLLDSNISSSVPSSLIHSPLFHLTTLSSSPSHPIASGSDPFSRSHNQLLHGIESLITARPESGSTPRPVCAVIDHIMNKTQEIFWKFNIPTVTFITSGACWAAVQHAAWVARAGDLKPGQETPLPGLPQSMVLSYSDIKQRRPWLPPGSPTPSGGEVHPGGASEAGMKLPRGPPLPGQPAPWVVEVQNSEAILFNTCDELERVFLDYVSDLTRKPVWGVGPLLPDLYWKPTDSILRDRDIRPKQESNYTEDEIIHWLDSKPRGAAILVSFGSEVNPTDEENQELAKAMEESTRPFIWVIQRKSGKTGLPSGPGPTGLNNPPEGYFPHGLSAKVGDRGLIIHGWAPQLLILSHESTGVFVSHCGWNSTTEAIVRGVPLLAWPIRGDQYYNAKLVVSYLRIGVMVSEGYPEKCVEKDDVVKGIEGVLSDDGIRSRALGFKDKFANGFPTSSLSSLDAFSEFIRQKAV